MIRKPNVVCQTRQNTQIQATPGSAEEQFAAISAVVQAEALQVIDDLLSKDESVDYSTPMLQATNIQAQVHQARPQLSDAEETSNSLLDSTTDSSLDTSSIEVIPPTSEGLEITLPISP